MARERVLTSSYSLPSIFVLRFVSLFLPLPAIWTPAMGYKRMRFYLCANAIGLNRGYRLKPITTPPSAQIYSRCDDYGIEHYFWHYWLSLSWLQAKVTIFSFGLKHLTTFLFCFVIDISLLPVARDSNLKETNQNNSWNLAVLKPKYFEQFFERCSEIFDCVLWVVS